MNLHKCKHCGSENQFISVPIDGINCAYMASQCIPVCGNCGTKLFTVQDQIDARYNRAEQNEEVFLIGDNVSGIKITKRGSSITMSIKEGQLNDYDSDTAVILQRNGKIVKVKIDTLRHTGKKNALQESIEKIKELSGVLV